RSRNEFEDRSTMAIDAAPRRRAEHVAIGIEGETRSRIEAVDAAEIVHHLVSACAQPKKNALLAFSAKLRRTVEVAVRCEGQTWSGRQAAIVALRIWRTEIVQHLVLQPGFAGREFIDHAVRVASPSLRTEKI